MDDHSPERATAVCGVATATVTRAEDVHRSDTRTPRKPARGGDGWIVGAVLVALFVLLLAASVDLVVAVAATAVVGIAAQGLRGGRAPRS